MKIKKMRLNSESPSPIYTSKNYQNQVFAQAFHCIFGYNRYIRVI